MGVQGLWNLLSPVGRRVNVETLAGKRLAIDASIWMIQFMKAMRDERGEMVRNAHLLGFFRRICKLLFLRTKPVFVFDGGTPFLKRRTVIARRRQREDAQYNLRKTAEKLLLNQLKKTRLKELAKELEEQKRMKNQDKGKKVAESDVGSPDRNGARAAGLNQEELDAMLAASLAAEERDTHNTGASASSYAFHGQDGGASASSYAFHGPDGGASTSAIANSVDDVEDEDEDDEEMILPITNGNIDPAALAALPPSMQLDLLVRMRERLMAENRQKYQKVKKDPQEFSELQIETYLKTVAFRREIDEVQKAASGRGVGGLQTARIAAEGNKEFIFSSSFTGDKHVLASAGMKKTVENQDGAEVVHSFTQPTTLDSAVASSGVSVRSSDVAPTSSGNDSRKDFGSDVQTYRDERGLMRVSRVRAMGIRMTRDLQRNLDLMKEKEQDTTSGASVPLNVPVNHAEKDVGNNKQISENFSEISGEISSKTTETHEKYRPTTTIETSFEISFEDDAQCMPVDNDDDFFASLVAGDPDPINSVDESDSDCEWEEDNIGIQIENVKLAAKTSQLEERNDDETELQWEDGLSNNPEDATLCPAKSMQTKSRGSIEEEAALQEAIRISLEGSKGEMDASCNLKRDNKVIHLMSEAPPDQDNVIGAPKKYSSDSSPDMIQMESADDACQNIDMVVGIPSENCVRSDVGCLTECGMNILGETAKAQSNTTVGTPEKSYNPLSDVPCESPCSTLHSHVADVTLADPLNLTCQKISQTDEAVPPIRHSKEAPDVAINMEKSEEPIPDAGINRIVRKAEPNHGFDEREHHFVGRDNEDDNIQVAGARLEDEIQQLDEEYAYLEDEHKKSERNADSVSSEMYVECQELLQMFGIPYVIAPMEAEAQCAYMELAGLVEGVVTDDSDVFLFGARSVYKNIFDDRKYVETYLMKDMENELGLTREKLIRIALLLGSDYTEGVSGIGIVNAIEVVNAFPEENGLSKFREWVESPDPTILGLSRMTPGSSLKKKRSKSSDTSMDASNVTSSNCDDHEKAKNTHELENVPKITQIFMKKHRNVSKNWHIPSSFPSEAVISAYASPQVDKSADPCSWGEPDLSALRRLCLEKFGWASQKAEELLLPVLKEYNKRETQLRMEAFYTFNERFAKIRSKRIKQAVKGITGNQSLESTNDPKVGSKRNKRKKPTKNDTVCGEESVDYIAKESKKSKTRRESFSSKKEKTSESVLEKEAGSRGDAGATTKGKRKTQAGGRRKRKRTTDVGRSDADSSDDEEELQLQKAEAPDRLRRSTRSKKSAKYAESDEEVDLTTQSMCDATEEEKLRDQDFDNDDSVCHSEIGQLTARDSVLDDGLCGDHLLKAGGFCADEDEPENETGTVQDDSAPVEADRHYLQMGGGFCADEDELENETGTLQDDSAPVEVDRYYLQMGGGFCADEDEPKNETETLQDISAPVDVDRHYLRMGGGFCFDDRDSDHDSQNRTSEETEVTLKEIEENASQMCSSTPSQGALGSAAGIQSSNPSGLQQQQQDHNDTASGSASQPGKAISEVKEDTNSHMKALSAMPYLRRRRKKNF